MEYNNINELFEPIFKWLKENYPNGAYFLVDKHSAKLYSNENITVFSNEIKSYSENMLNRSIEENNKIESTPCLFKLNKDILKENEETVMTK